jgi:hypothetical protein
MTPHDIFFQGNVNFATQWKGIKPAQSSVLKSNNTYVLPRVPDMTTKYMNFLLAIAAVGVTYLSDCVPND